MFTLPQKVSTRQISKQAYNLNNNPYIFFGAALVILLGTLFFYTFPNIKKLNEVKTEITTIEQKNLTLDADILAQDTERQKILQKLDLFEDKYRPRIEKAFPFEEDIGNLTRFLESFSLALEKKGIISLRNISYGQSKKVEDGKYSALPIRLSFEANNINFVKFMQMIKSSGSIEEKDFYEGKPVRLMQVDRINVNIPRFDQNTGEEQLYSINLQLSAFFRQPEQ